MGRRWKAIGNKWRTVRKSSWFHDALFYLIFVAVAAVFWFIIALNDNVSRTFRVALRFENVPDSVTFISDPPEYMSVTVRDKGSNILRSGVLKHPSVSFNFRDFATNGTLRLSQADINTALKNSFGSSMQVAAVSLDSLRLSYTTDRGRRVPVVVRVDVSAASGYIISGPPIAKEKSVLLYSIGSQADSVRHVYTQVLTRSDLSSTASYKVSLKAIPNVKMVPDVIDVEIPVEPIVRKEGFADVEVLNLPKGESLLLFPNKVPVEYYIPMSQFSRDDIELSATVDYYDILRTSGSRLPLSMGASPAYVLNPALKLDSVEYTIVK